MGAFELALALRDETLAAACSAGQDLLFIGRWERWAPLAARFHAAGHTVALAEAPGAVDHHTGRRLHLVIAEIENTAGLAAVTWAWVLARRELRARRLALCTTRILTPCPGDPTNCGGSCSSCRWRWQPRKPFRLRRRGPRATPALAGCGLDRAAARSPHRAGSTAAASPAVATAAR